MLEAGKKRHNRSTSHPHLHQLELRHLIGQIADDAAGARLLSFVDLVEVDKVTFGNGAADSVQAALGGVSR
jgi:hypothetical protein